ncbi:hypothetical protein Ngar_c33100 [Candidatus Nitrososphaera gargensis Ga9.2]|uniref:Uncharacterized protein n=1 Tax=Nitrososphaera gargensis (strain Ga9.2) TaxID=1237085 RepID=K0IJL4_NITGG|nr:hypothetical protein [Candidatus Nitrososphaera gargensis]AFU60225.1 hypothetical protein Ngar_c33100 [Candidatus Nitrososphaera gargensis Ga9.2]
MTQALWESRQQVAACACSVCNHQNTRTCIEERCNCCSVEHAFLLTNPAYEEAVL